MKYHVTVDAFDGFDGRHVMNGTWEEASIAVNAIIVALESIGYEFHPVEYEAHVKRTIMMESMIGSFGIFLGKGES